MFQWGAASGKRFPASASPVESVSHAAALPITHNSVVFRVGTQPAIYPRNFAARGFFAFCYPDFAGFLDVQDLFGGDSCIKNTFFAKKDTKSFRGIKKLAIFVLDC